jgi:Cytochrome C biogenesis protein
MLLSHATTPCSRPKATWKIGGKRSPCSSARRSSNSPQCPVQVVGSLQSDHFTSAWDWPEVRWMMSEVASGTSAMQSVAESDAAASRGIRTLIAERIDQGASDDAIRHELAATPGESIPLTPNSSGAGASCGRSRSRGWCLRSRGWRMCSGGVARPRTTPTCVALT